MEENKNSKKEWFQTWFDSKYYHILYQHRNHQEAQAFIQNLVQLLSCKDQDIAIDLACGKGRHSLELFKHGLYVEGLDLSANSIAEAKKHTQKGLSFHVHDMRQVYKVDHADYVFNLFTSFGYFNNQDDNLSTLKHVYNALKPKGKLIIDYLNPGLITKHFPIKEEKEINGLQFHIRKHCDSHFIYKDIEFEDGGKSFRFQEKVQKISSDTFVSWLEQSGFKVDHQFGDYNLQTFDEEWSARQIIVAHKP